MADINVSAITGSEGYLTKISTRNHIILVDEPLDKGGKDLAPKPGELLAASLASCTAITLRMYINRKEWKVGDIIVDVDIDRDDKITATTFTRKIKFTEAELDEDQLKRLTFIANACPVHKMLSSQIEIKTQIN